MLDLYISLIKKNLIKLDQVPSSFRLKVVGVLQEYADITK